MNKKIKTIFMGTPAFAVPALKSLIQSDFIEIIAIVCNQDKPVGRKKIITPPPVKILAQKYGIPTLQPDKISKPEWIKKIKDLNPELIIVAAFGQMIPKDILDIPKYKAINIHGSLLPKLRGASPIQYAILKGYEKTGVTIMLIDEIMDHGEIISQKSVSITPQETSATLYKKIAALGANLLIETLPKYLNNKIIPQPQNENEATYAGKIKTENAFIASEDLEKAKNEGGEIALEIDRKIRAFNPEPGAFTFINEKRVKLLEAEIFKGKLKLKKIQIEGGKPKAI